MTEVSFRSSWQTRNTAGQKISAFLSFINSPPPPLIELRVNWPFSQLQHGVNEVLWSIYECTVFIVSLLPPLTLKVFCRMLQKDGGGADSVWAWYENTQFAHQSCIFISWHLLTFCAFPFISVPVMQQINTVNIENTKQRWTTKTVLWWCWVGIDLNF